MRYRYLVFHGIVLAACGGPAFSGVNADPPCQEACDDGGVQRILGDGAADASGGPTQTEASTSTDSHVASDAGVRSDCSCDVVAMVPEAAAPDVTVDPPVDSGNSHSDAGTSPVDAAIDAPPPPLCCGNQTCEGANGVWICYFKSNPVYNTSCVNAWQECGLGANCLRSDGTNNTVQLCP